MNVAQKSHDTEPAFHVSIFVFEANAQLRLIVHVNEAEEKCYVRAFNTLDDSILTLLNGAIFARSTTNRWNHVQALALSLARLASDGHEFVQMSRFNPLHESDERTHMGERGIT